MNRAFYIHSRRFKIPLSIAEFVTLSGNSYYHDVSDYLEAIDGVTDSRLMRVNDKRFLYLTVMKEHDNDNTLHKISDVINREVKRERGSK